MRRWPHAVAGMMAATILVPLMMPSPAAGADSNPLLAVTVAGGGPLLHLENLAPGARGSGQAAIRNLGDAPAQLHLEAVNVADDDNGCNDPEQKAGDTTCGPSGGELGHDLRLAVRLQRSPDGEPQPVFSGTVIDLAQGVWLGDAPIPAAATWTMNVDYELPRATGNDVQGDRLGFDLEFAVAAVTPAVLGTHVERDVPRAHIPGAELPFSGGVVGSRLQLGVFLLAAGGLLLFAGRRRHGRLSGDPACLRRRDLAEFGK